MNSLDKTLRLWRTLRPVPLQALLWRAWARGKRYYYSSPLYGLAGIKDTAAPAVQWAGVELISGDANIGREIAAGKFTFVGHTEQLEIGIPNWLPSKASHLWLFNLHYHEWLADLKASGQREAAQNLVANWLLHFGSYHPMVWHPYPTSLRIVAWLTYGEWLLQDGATAEFKEAFLNTLARQASYLADNLEWDLGGNHLLKNLKALIYAGIMLEDQSIYYERGMAELLRQIKTQILPDGGHYERSPLYQAQVLRDFLEIRALLRKRGSTNKVLDGICASLGGALSLLCHPDGGLSLFNDSAVLENKYVDQLLRLSGADDNLEILPDSGYAKLSRGKTVVLLNAGKVGPDENPGHAHADTLSFELSHQSKRIFVNSGTYAYQHHLRQILRSTPAHNTVAVNNDNSAEVWAAFRVGRRPHHVTLQVEGEDKAELTATASHDGYRHQGIIHQRKLVLDADGTRLRGEDLLKIASKGKRYRITAHFHLHPEVSVKLISDHEAELTLSSERKATFHVEGGQLDVKDSSYAPQFGLLLTSRQLVVHSRLEDRDLGIFWELRFKTA